MSDEGFDLDPGNIDLGDYDTYGDDCGAPDFSDMDEQGFRGHPVEQIYEDGDDDIEELIFERVLFADPSGISALRASSSTNPRNLPCPTCGEENRLTPADAAQGYQCDKCAERAERGW